MPMSTAKTETIPTVDRKPHAAFFRQSGWLMVANIVGGLMTLGVHPLNKRIPDSEYTAFGVLLMVVSCLPTMPLQMVFAQQSALALANGRERQLAGMIRLVWLWTFIVWALGALAVFLFQGAIVQLWQLPGVAGLLVTLPLLLVSLWVPLFSGVLQGRQDFFWLGWASILGGAGRLGFAVLLVLALGFGATGLITGALIGMGMTAVIAIWRTRDLWSLRAEPFDVKSLLRQVLPLVFGFGACQFMFTSDTMFAKAYFSPDAMKPYLAAGTLARGLLWLVLPLATVMFPKIVHANARSEKNNLFGLVVLGTAGFGICGMAGLWLVGPLLVKIIYKTGDLAGTMALIPWYAGAMVPLAMANVLVNDLLARVQFRVVPFMVALALAYGFALPLMLNHFPGRLEIVPQTLGAFNLLLFLVCAWFTWGAKAKTKMEDGR
jgi:O-antigen/teichoic acid export membrane protein